MAKRRGRPGGGGFGQAGDGGGNPAASAAAAEAGAGGDGTPGRDARGTGRQDACRHIAADLFPPGATGPYTYEPCDDADPLPDHENVLTE